MQLVVLGLNHKTAPVDVRERCALSKDAIRIALHTQADDDRFKETVLLSTCNRSELYAVIDDTASCLDVLRFWETIAGGEAVQPYVYQYTDEACIRHLFRVTASLDSLVIGEGQILSQVKEAYRLAHDLGATGTVLNTLFHRAMATGKRVRTETRITRNAVSVSSAAVELAKHIFGTLEASNALLFGAGKMAELTAKHLYGNGIRQVYVANHHRDRAETLANACGGIAIDFAHGLAAVPDVDVVVTSTGAPHCVIHPADTARAMQARDGRPLVFIDIAVPRDVDPEVASIPGVTLYNIDDLQEVVDEHVEARRHEAMRAEAIVEEEVAAVQEKFRYLSMQPLMAHLSDRADEMRRRELQRALSKLKSLDADEQKVIEQMSRRIVRKLLRFPMMQANAAAGTADEPFYMDAMSHLFKMDASENVEDATDSEALREE